MPAEVRVKIEGRLRKALQKLGPETADRATLAGANAIGLVMMRALAENSGPPFVRRRTGTLGRSWRFTPRSDGVRFVNLARSRSTRTPYARFLEFGTKAHEVKPRFKKALRWRTGGRAPISAFRATRATARGNFLFSKGHRVSGIRPRKIFRTTFRQEGPEIVKQMGLAIRGQIEKAAAL